MKKILLMFPLLFLTACAGFQQKPVERQRIEITRTERFIDMCDRRAMPRFSNRPRLTSKDLSGLTSKQLDEKLQAHLKALDAHIDKLESVIVRTRDRVQECR